MLQPFSKNKDTSTITKAQLQTRLEVLEADWKKFDKDHERICESKTELLENLDYLNEDHYSRGKEAYLINKSEMMDLLDLVSTSSLQNILIHTRHGSFTNASRQNHHRCKTYRPSSKDVYGLWKILKPGNNLTRVEWRILPKIQFRFYLLKIKRVKNTFNQRTLGLKLEGLTKSSSCCVELHGFSDASQSAMAAVVYIKVRSESGIFVNIVCAKTRVASLKKMSIPRLELTAALMLVRLAKYVRDILDIKSAPLWLWTDSRVTLTWIQNHPSKWKDFVCNRVSIIQETEPLARWRYVPGKENPADCASRGLSPKALVDHKLWWSGPSWLAEDSVNWPMSSDELAEEAVSEQRSQKSTYLSQSKSEPDLLSRYSDLNKLLRITAWCRRFINRLKKIDSIEHTPYLTPKELNDSLLLWTGIVQLEAFNEDLKQLTNQKPINKLSKLRNFTPFLDQNKLIRVGGKLNQSTLEYDSKHPLLLPKDSNLSKLIISDSHLRTLHGSTSITLSTIRQRFWILGGRPAIKKELLRCVTCARYRAERAQQLMGQLPTSRVTPSRPFLHSGVDYAGPFVIKTWREAFIAAYKRFTARRGISSTLSSDCGTTFIGADAELKRLFTASTTTSTKLRDLLTKDGTLWKFNPPSAPHFGGHWEAGVNCVIQINIDFGYSM
ncbi:uncharacterized protein LOC128984579 [Macrosteles quadrilineatus]|uniref:uncharacterized protein LOC128984579 n=1 Tax=Macrosteles quadrilineatus TaxID=74068 RepID=UPI0023E2E0A9|nr:uncharacterized protein LOC128984579 [Macrosteles quadrilineatus]